MPLADEPYAELLAAVASDAVTPSGGSVAALTGAAGASLCEMVCIHTLQYDRTDATEPLSAAGERLETRRRELLALADEDVAAVERMQTVRDDPGSAGEDSEAVSLRAAEVPMETAAACRAVLDHAQTAATAGSDRTRADAVTGGYLAHAALRASLATMRANLVALSDPAFVAWATNRADALEREGEQTLGDIVAEGP